MPDSDRRALVVTEDLFFGARIVSVLRRLGFQADSAATAEDAIGRSATAPDLAIVNLAGKRLDGMETVRRLKERGVRRVVAFISHTLIPEVRDGARAAGADMVCANSAITQRLPEIVERVFAADGDALAQQDE